MAGLKFLLLLGELGAFEPSDEFFGLARKHRTANDFESIQIVLYDLLYFRETFRNFQP
jgi:hypothetical protein